MIGNQIKQEVTCADCEQVVLEQVTPEHIPQYIANLEKYISKAKELHWSATDDKTHVLCDELTGELSELQDDIAEMYMGYDGNKFQLGFLDSACTCDATTLPELLDCLLGDTFEMNNAIDEVIGFRGIRSKLNKLIGYLEAMKYKETQK